MTPTAPDSAVHKSDPPAAAAAAAAPAKKRFGGKRLITVSIVLGIMAALSGVAAVLLPKGATNQASGESGGEHADEIRTEKPESLVEAEIGKFSVSIDTTDGMAWNVRFTLVAAVAPHSQTHFSEAVEGPYRARVRQAVVKVVRMSTIENLRDPQLDLLKRSLRTEINNTLPEPYIKEVIVSEISMMQL